jgi:hypothetical protein
MIGEYEEVNQKREVVKTVEPHLRAFINSRSALTNAINKRRVRSVSVETDIELTRLVWRFREHSE